MFVNNTFPFVMPRLCLAISYFEEIDVASKEVEFLVYLPGDPFEAPSMRARSITERELPLPDFAMPPPLGDEPVIRGLRVEQRLAFMNLVLKEPGFIRVRADTALGRIRLGGLRVEQSQIAAPQ